MYEQEIKQIATWLNGKFDLLGDRISEGMEQMALEWGVGAIVRLCPETVKGIPVRQLAVRFVIDWIDEPEGGEKTQAVAAFLSNEYSKAA